MTSPIEVSLACPECGHEAVLDDLAAAENLACACGWSAPRFAGCRDARDRPVRCALCGDPRLFVQKDFSRKVGMAAVVGGFALAVGLGVFLGPWGFFGTLGAAALLDGLLYAFVVGEVVVCHWCETHYRGGPLDYPAFDLEEHDRVRHQKEVAAQGHPVPEHEGREASPAERAAHPRSYDDG